MSLLAKTISGFEQVFGAKPLGVWSAPGRVNLIGEHTDYNEGFVLPFAINRRTFAAISPRGDGIARVSSAFSKDVIEISVSQISAESVSGWSAYPLGVAFALKSYSGMSEGFNLYVESDVPVGAGLSSSAAIECSVAIGLNELWNANASIVELSKIGQRAENEIVGAPTGIMDQTASLKGAVDCAVFLDCQSLETELIPLGFYENGLELLIVDTKVAHRLTDGGYAARRAACEKGAEAFSVSSLRALGTQDLPKAKALLDDVTYRRVRHVITENERVQKTVGILKALGATAIGDLLYASHESMRDDFEISIEELDVAVETAMSLGAIGARMTGGGFGGAAIALVRQDQASFIAEHITEKFQERGFIKPDIFPVTADAGAKREL